MAWGWWSSSPPNDEPKSSPQQQPQQPSDFETTFPHLATTSPPPRPEIDPLLPTTMSCRDAFDSAFYCASFGGHFNDVYRYGQMRSCSEHWADWRFCMRIKTLSAEARVHAIQDRYRQKEEKIRAGPNSEQVWTRRGEGGRVERPFGRAGEA